MALELLNQGTKSLGFMVNERGTASLSNTKTGCRSEYVFRWQLGYEFVRV